MLNGGTSNSARTSDQIAEQSIARTATTHTGASQPIVEAVPAPTPVARTTIVKYNLFDSSYQRDVYPEATEDMVPLWRSRGP